jgi:hypothetical protein
MPAYQNPRSFRKLTKFFASCTNICPKLDVKLGASSPVLDDGRKPETRFMQQVAA